MSKLIDRASQEEARETAELTTETEQTVQTAQTDTDVPAAQAEPAEPAAEAGTEQVLQKGTETADLSAYMEPADADGTGQPLQKGAETADLSETMVSAEENDLSDLTELTGPIEPPAASEPTMEIDREELTGELKATAEVAAAMADGMTADLTGELEAAEETAASDAETEELSEETETAGPKRSPGHPRKRSRKHRRRNRLLQLMIVAGVIAVFAVVANLPYFGITETPVIGNRTVSDDVILELSQIEKGDSIFLLNPWLTASRIKKDKYIESVRIKRHLPGTVEIYVTERPSAAQFVMKDKDGKKSYVITDADGMVMGIFSKKKKVTMVREIKVTHADEGSKIQVDNTGAYHKAMKLIATAKAGDLYFKSIEIKGSMVKAYIFDDLKCRGRFENMISSIETGELKAVVYRLYQQDVSRGTINIGDNNYCSFTPK